MLTTCRARSAEGVCDPCSFAAALIIAGGLLLTAAGPVGAQPFTLWSATFTTDQGERAGTTYTGCSNLPDGDLDSCSTALNGNDLFEFRGEQYRVRAVENYTGTLEGDLIYVDAVTTFGTVPIPRGEFALYYGGTRYDSRLKRGEADVYQTPGVTWANNVSVTVRLDWEGAFGASCIPSLCSYQITPKTSLNTRCSASMLPNFSINGRIRSSGQLGRW